MEIAQSAAIRVPVCLADSATGDGLAGVAYDDVTVYLQKQAAGAGAKSVTVDDWFEIDAVNMPGEYDLLLSAADTNTLGFLKYTVAASGAKNYNGLLEVGYHPLTTVDFIESQRGRHTFQGAGQIFYVGPTTGNDTTGNGSRSAPYATITKALSMVTAGHSVIFVLADAGLNTATTLVETVDVNKRFCFIRGPGRDLIIQGASSNTPTFTISADGVELSGFQVDSHATGAASDGVLVNGVDFARLSRLWINATRGDGVDVAAGSNNARIDDCRFDGAGLAGSSHGLRISGGDAHKVLGCHFSDVQGDAIRITGNGQDHLIDGCNIHDSTGYGINIINGTDITVTAANYYHNNVSGDVFDGGTSNIIEKWADAADYTSARAALLDGLSALPADPASEAVILSAISAVQSDVGAVAGDVTLTMADVTTLLSEFSKLKARIANYVIDTFVVDANGQVTQARVRTYDSQANADAAYSTAPSGGTTGLVETCPLVAAYSGTTPSKVKATLNP